MMMAGTEINAKHLGDEVEEEGADHYSDLVKEDSLVVATPSSSSWTRADERTSIQQAAARSGILSNLPVVEAEGDAKLRKGKGTSTDKQQVGEADEQVAPSHHQAEDDTLLPPSQGLGLTTTTTTTTDETELIRSEPKKNIGRHSTAVVVGAIPSTSSLPSKGLGGNASSSSSNHNNNQQRKSQVVVGRTSVVVVGAVPSNDSTSLPTKGLRGNSNNNHDEKKESLINVTKDHSSSSATDLAVVGAIPSTGGGALPTTKKGSRRTSNYSSDMKYIPADLLLSSSPPVVVGAIPSTTTGTAASSLPTKGLRGNSTHSDNSSTPMRRSNNKRGLGGGNSNHSDTSIGLGGGSSNHSDTSSRLSSAADSSSFEFLPQVVVGAVPSTDSPLRTKKGLQSNSRSNLTRGGSGGGKAVQVTSSLSSTTTDNNNTTTKMGLRSSPRHYDDISGKALQVPSSSSTTDNHATTKMGLRSSPRHYVDMRSSVVVGAVRSSSGNDSLLATTKGAKANNDLRRLHGGKLEPVLDGKLQPVLDEHVGDVPRGNRGGEEEEELTIPPIFPDEPIEEEITILGATSDEPFCAENTSTLDDPATTLPEYHQEPSQASLAQAMPVNEESNLFNIMESAEPIDLDASERRKAEHQRNDLKSLLCMAMCFFCLIVVIVLGSILGNRNNSMKGEEFGDDDDSNGSSWPLPPLSNLHDLYEGLPDGTKQSLADTETPQRKAWDWLLGHQNITNLEEWRKKQIFAMATFYHSLSGPNWPKSVGEEWLDDTIEECRWVSTSVEYLKGIADEHLGSNELNFNPCNSAGELNSLVLMNLKMKNAKPFMPPEISFLTSLTVLGLISSKINAHLADLLTLEVIQLPNLELINFSDNDIYGPMPKEIAGMKSLLHVVLYSNQLSGRAPTELGLMTSVSSINLYRNRLSGLIPSELGMLANLDKLVLGFNDFTGVIPTELAMATSITWLHLDVNHMDPNSPQAKAFEWLLEDLEEQQQDQQQENITTTSVLQRFSLVTLFHATGGEEWRNSENWLQHNVSECDWYSKVTEPLFLSRPTTLSMLLGR